MRAPALAERREIFLGQAGGALELVAGKHYGYDTANADLRKDGSLAFKITRISLVPLAKQMNWNFSDSRRTNLSLDEFLDGQDPTKFFSGKEPWLEGVKKLSWQNVLSRLHRRDGRPLAEGHAY
jgi:hypothetical protein